MALPETETPIAEIQIDNSESLLKKFQATKQRLLDGEITNTSIADYIISKKDLDTRRNAELIERELDSFFGSKEQAEKFKNTHLKPTFSTQEARDESLAEAVFERLEDRDNLTPTQEELLEKATEIINTDMETVCIKLYTEPESITEEEKNRIKASVQRIKSELTTKKNNEQLENAFNAYIETLS